MNCKTITLLAATLSVVAALPGLHEIPIHEHHDEHHAPAISTQHFHLHNSGGHHGVDGGHQGGDGGHHGGDGSHHGGDGGHHGGDGGHHGGNGGHHGGDGSHHGHNEEHHGHPKYEFEYKVEDPHTGDKKYQKESRDGDKVHGLYHFVEADGRLRTVKYHADKHSGFNAEVTHTGHAIHDQPKHHH